MIWKYRFWKNVNPKSFYFHMENIVRGEMLTGHGTTDPTELEFTKKQVSRALHNHGILRGLDTFLARRKLILDGYLTENSENVTISFSETQKGINNYYGQETVV